MLLKEKSIDNLAIINALSVVGMTRFELATTRPPDAYSTGLSYIPNCGCKSSALFLNSKYFMPFFIGIYALWLYLADKQLELNLKSARIFHKTHALFR